MKSFAEEMTGCPGAGDYRRWARKRGYKYIETVDLTSSAGDWSFIVSQDGLVWYFMFQENNYPKPGFSRSINKQIPYFGTAKEVLALICEESEFMR